MKNSTRKTPNLSEGFLNLPDPEQFESKSSLIEPNEMFKMCEQYLPILNANPTYLKYRVKDKNEELFRLL